MSDFSTMTIDRGTRPANRVRASERQVARGARRATSAGRKAPARAKKPEGASAPARAREMASGAAERLGRWKAPLVALALVLVVIVALYAPAKGLYSAWRIQGERQAQLDELNASNEECRSDISRLQSREGIEDEARKRGYVSEGETSVIVEGLPEDDSASDSSQEELPWYIELGDLIFQYEGA